MPPISFNLIDTDGLVPGVRVEFSAINANQSELGQPFTALIVGQKLAAGTAVAGVPIQVVAKEQAWEFFGRGSLAARMVEAFRENNRHTELWVIPLDDNGAGVAATGNVKFTGPATESGTLNLYVAGQRVQVGITSADTASDIATATVAALGAVPDLPVSAAVNGGDPTQVDLAALHKGETGNDLDVRVNYRVGERTPTGVTVAITAMGGGVSNPDVSGVPAAMGDTWYNVIAWPYTDATSIATLDTELVDRWGPDRPIDGVAFAALRGTFGQISTWAAAQNSPHISVMGADASPTPPPQWAAAVAGQVATAAKADPARPFQTLELTGILPPEEGADRFTRLERGLLLDDGIATFEVTRDGSTLIERLVTLYTETAQQIPDRALSDVNTLYTLSRLRFTARSRFSTKFPRHKIIDGSDSRRPQAAGQAVVSLQSLRNEAIALARSWEDEGWVENIDQFKDEILVERDAQNPSAVNMVMPPDIVNPLRNINIQIAFRL